MALLGLFRGNGPTGFGFSSTSADVTAGLDLSGKTFLVTGVRSGIGANTVTTLTSKGAHVIATGRKSEDAAAVLAGAPGTPLSCELSDPASVRACVTAVKATGKKLDGILCNAGVMAIATLQTKHGLEMQFFTNHVGHFILVTGLLDQLTEKGRVVMTSSDAHLGAPRVGIDFDNLDGSKGYRPWAFYGQSKLANLLFARQLAKRLAGSGRTANAIHPGVINTGLQRHMSPIARVGMSVVAPIGFKSIPQGAATQCFVATHPKAEGVTGEYWADCNLKRSSRNGRDLALAEKLWAKTEEIVARLLR